MTFKPPHAAAFLISFLMLAAVLGVPQSSAQSYDPKAAELCTDDAMRLCNEFVPDVDKITACMQKKRRQLSPACLAVFRPKRHRHAPVN